MEENRCFAEDMYGNCTALDVNGCLGYLKCAFYKNCQKARDDYEQAEITCNLHGYPANHEYVLYKKSKDLVEQLKKG